MACKTAAAALEILMVMGTGKVVKSVVGEALSSAAEFLSAAGFKGRRECLQYEPDLQRRQEGPRELRDSEWLYGDGGSPCLHRWTGDIRLTEES